MKKIFSDSGKTEKQELSVLPWSILAGMDRDKKRERDRRYKASRVRLDIQLSPEQLQQFKALPGLDGQSYPDRLQAIMQLWESVYLVPGAGSLPLADIIEALTDSLANMAETQADDNLHSELDSTAQLLADLLESDQPHRP